MSRHNSWGWIRGFSRIAFGQSAARDSGLLLQGLKARLWGLGGLLEVKVRTGLHLLHIWQHPELHLTKLRVPPTSASLRAVFFFFFFTLLSAHNCTFQHFKQPNISWCNFSSKCIPEYSVTALQSQKKVELQSGVRGAATHGPLIWALYKVEPKCVRICGASRWLKCIFKSNVISAPSLSGDSDFQSVLENRNKM